MNKLRIVEYFDGLINKLDKNVETAIKDNHRDDDLIARLNKQRDEFIKEIRSVEADNMSALKELNVSPSDKLSDDKLFPKFCFFLKFPEKIEKQMYCYEELVEQEIGLKLIVTDKYLSEGQVECFEAMFNLLEQTPPVPGEETFLRAVTRDLFFTDKNVN
jgi:hypothetical protein